MRGIVYRLGRRRAGSALVASAVALTLALGSVSSALAKTPAHATAAAHAITRVPAHTAPVSLRTVAKTDPVAHAAGHKIA
jgi:hypothetical protein